MSARSGILACTLFLLVTGVAMAGTPPQGPKELWREFPLEPAVTSPVLPAASAPTETAPAPAAQSAESGAEVESGSSIRLVALVLGGLAGCVLGVVSAIWLAKANWRRHPAPAPTDAETPEKLVERAEEPAVEEGRTIALREQRGRVVPMAKEEDQALPAEAVLDTSESSSYAEIGERVAAVLSAAEAAAEQIRVDARRQAEAAAEEIRAEARRQAEEALEQARHEADGIRAEAAAYETETHAAVDSFAAERRREAEQHVRQQLADAEAQARATREAAEEMAVQIEEGGRQRQLALQEESRSVEEAMQRALQELRRMTLQLEALVGTPGTRPDGNESLVDALMPYSAVGANDA
jgi:hypothetical protein